MFNFGRRIIKVTFLDQASGRVISSARMPLDRLPQRFDIATALNMEGERYVVVSAHPATKSEFSATKELKVVVRKTA